MRGGPRRAPGSVAAGHRQAGRRRAAAAAPVGTQPEVWPGRRRGGSVHCACPLYPARRLAHITTCALPPMPSDRFHSTYLGSRALVGTLADVGAPFETSGRRCCFMYGR